MNKLLRTIIVIVFVIPICSHANTQSVCENIDSITSLEHTDFQQLERAAQEYFKSSFAQAPQIKKAFTQLPDNWLKQEFYTELAMCFMRGKATVNKKQKAKSFLAIAQTAGSDKAAHMLASLRVFHSTGFSEQALGVEYLKKEYSEGSAFAAGKLGWAYQHGYGIEANLEKALELYHHAAENGMTYWQFLLSHAYEKGYLGLDINKEKASYWLNYQQKVHLAKYECWLVTYYENGTYPLNETEYQKYTEACVAENK